MEYNYFMKLCEDQKCTSAFTLLELIIVIIIVGILASLALPRFFKMIETSHATEALVNIGALRQAVERCYSTHSNYAYCTVSSFDIDNLSNSPNAHFTYGIQMVFDETYHTLAGYSITASRNTLDHGKTTSRIQLNFNGDNLTITGEGDFEGIQ